MEILSVDRSLKVTLLYDGDELPQPASLKKSAVGARPVYRIKVEKPGLFDLYETAGPGMSLTDPGAIVSPPARVFAVDFSKGHFRIRIRPTKTR
jgi:hypothetical protein